MFVFLFLCSFLPLAVVGDADVGLFTYTNFVFGSSSTAIKGLWRADVPLATWAQYYLAFLTFSYNSTKNSIDSNDFLYSGQIQAYEYKHQAYYSYLGYMQDSFYMGNGIPQQYLPCKFL